MGRIIIKDPAHFSHFLFSYFLFSFMMLQNGIFAYNNGTIFYHFTFILEWRIQKVICQEHFIGLSNPCFN